MNESIIEFQKQRIVALENENGMLRSLLDKRDCEKRAHQARLTSTIFDEAYNQPIEGIVYKRDTFDIRNHNFK